MTASCETQEQLIETCQNLVHSLAVTIHRKLPPNVELEDLVAYGQVGLAEAARDFNPARGSRFSTYAYYRIRGAIYDGLSKMAWLSRSQYNRVRSEQMANEVLQAEGGKSTAAEEGGTRSDVRWLRNTTRALAVVYLATSSDLEEESGRASLEDRSVPGAPELAMSREMADKLHDLIDGLPSEPRHLIRSVYFEGLTLQEAGNRLNISKSWASRLHAKTLQRLARSLRFEGDTS